MNETHPNPETRIALFQRKEIRRTIHNKEWWFVVEDVVLALIDSRDPKQYIQRMKQRDPELGKGWVQIVHTLSVHTDGGQQPMLTDLELIFSMLGEAATTEITRTRDTQGFPQNKHAAHAGDTVAGNARRELEKKSVRKVVTSENYLALAQSAKKLSNKAPRKNS